MARHKIITPPDPRFELAKKRDRIHKTVDGVYIGLLLICIIVCGFHQENVLVVGLGLMVMGVLSIPVTAFYIYAETKGWEPLFWYDEQGQRRYMDPKTVENDLARSRFISRFYITFLILMSIGLPVCGILKLAGIL